MEDYIRIAQLDNLVEAELLDEILNKRHIPHALISERDTAFDGLFQRETGWGALDGPTDKRDEILELLAGLRAGSPNAPPDTPA